jgi:hypothetical protein
MKSSLAWLIAIASIFGLLSSAPAYANLRAPMHVEAQPSSTLYPADQRLEVEQEELEFTCGPDSCAVQARYRVRVQEGGEGAYSFEFILPTDQPVKVLVGDRQVGTALVKPEKLSPREEAAVLPHFVLPLFKAGFTGTLRSGGNAILVGYRQPLSGMEHGHSYFRDGRWVHALQYEVWPLKEWRRAPGFRLRLVVKMEREEPGWWQQAFGTPRSLACQLGRGAGPADEQGEDLKAALQQEQGYLVLRAWLDGELPDRIRCYFGDEDLVAPDR